jgi:hypothetical protein
MNGKFSSLSTNALRRKRTLEDEDPAAGLSNLADCMLVLACGLMVALVVAWNIDIQTVTEVEMTDNKKEIDNVEDMNGDFESGGTKYVDVGRVYQDPDTGTYYILEDQ